MNSKVILQRSLLAIAATLFLQNAGAAGNIDLVAGTVSVTNAAGQLRVAAKGERIETGDAIATGRDGEIHVSMDDNGLIALRANTFLRIESYKAEGGPDDNVAFRLLRGSFRSITGWIGKNNPQKYAVRTATATIGIRGTDHETMVIGEGDDAGTYDKVNTGETSIETPLGTIAVLPGQAAFAPKAGSQPPRKLAAVPAAFVATANESQIETSKKVLEESREERLKAKQTDNERKGVGNDGKPKIGEPEDARKALGVVEDILRAFEGGNVGLIRQKLDPSMIGYQQLLDGIAREANECKQMRVTLLDTQVQASPDLAVVQTRWEKRCLLLPSFTPQLTSGRSTLLLHLGAAGWTFAAITPGSMLQPAPATRSTGPTRPPIGGGGGAVVDVPPARSLAVLTLSNSGTTFAGLTAAGGNALMPFTINVVDPDLAGAPFLNVGMTTNSLMIRDSRVIRLLPVAPGAGEFEVRNVQFQSAGRCATASTPVNPTALEICPNTTATVTFTDATTPSGLAQKVQQSVAIP
jgi:hypothetical protein